MNLLQHIAILMQDVQWPEGAKYVALSADNCDIGVLHFFSEMPEVKYNCSRSGRYHWVGENRIAHYERVPYHRDAKLRAFTQKEVAMAQYPLPSPEVKEEPKDNNEVLINLILLWLLVITLLNLIFVVRGHLNG